MDTVSNDTGDKVVDIAAADFEHLVIYGPTRDFSIERIAGGLSYIFRIHPNGIANSICTSCTIPAHQMADISEFLVSCVRREKNEVPRFGQEKNEVPGFGPEKNDVLWLLYISDEHGEQFELHETWEAAEKILKSRFTLPLHKDVGLTGHALTDRINEVYWHQAVEVLMKPLDIPEAQKKIQKSETTESPGKKMKVNDFPSFNEACMVAADVLCGEDGKVKSEHSRGMCDLLAAMYLPHIPKIKSREMVWAAITSDEVWNISKS